MGNTDRKSEKGWKTKFEHVRVLIKVASIYNKTKSKRCLTVGNDKNSLNTRYFFLYVCVQLPWDGPLIPLETSLTGPYRKLSTFFMGFKYPEDWGFQQDNELCLNSN